MQSSPIARSPRLFAIGAIAALALLGPPQIHVRAARSGEAGVPAGAVLVIEARHHADHGSLAVTGRAEGMRAGKRVTQPITLTSTGSGSYAVTRQWKAGSPWVLVFSAEQKEGQNHGLAEALVKIDSRGTIVNIETPRASIVATGTPDRIGEKAIAAALAAIAPW